MRLGTIISIIIQYMWFIFFLTDIPYTIVTRVCLTSAVLKFDVWVRFFLKKRKKMATFSYKKQSYENKAINIINFLKFLNSIADTQS